MHLMSFFRRSKIGWSNAKGLYNSQKTVLDDGKSKTIIADDKYIIKAINDPNSEIADGFSANLMQSYKDILTEDDLNKIIDFLKKEAQ